MSEMRPTFCFFCCWLFITFLGCSTSDSKRPARAQPQAVPMTIEQAALKVEAQNLKADSESPAPDEEKWNSLKVGMPIREVTALFGEPRYYEFNPGEVNGQKLFRATFRYVYDKGATIRTVQFESTAEEIKGDFQNTKLMDWTGKKGAP
jgi:hypothetical protein